MGSYKLKVYQKKRPKDFLCTHETVGVLGDALLWCTVCGSLITSTMIHVPTESEPDSFCWPQGKDFKRLKVIL